MSNSNVVPIVSAIGNTSMQERIAALQAQMALYSHYANGSNLKASAEYQNLHAAIASGNVIAAEVALGQLQRVDQSNIAATPAPLPPSPHSLDTTA